MRSVKKIVTICMDPQDIPQAMFNFAKNTLSQWENCDKKNLKAVSEFLAEMFYQFTDIHPFGNANGRTGTAEINLFLKAAKFPSILLRYPGEKSSNSSLYSLAISRINETRKPLANLIYQRIHEAMKTPFIDAKLAKNVSLNCALAKHLKQFKEEYPKVDINVYQKTVEQIGQSYESEMNSKDLLIFILENLIPIIVRDKKQLDDIKNSAKPIPFISTTSLGQQEREQITTNLTLLTKIEGWKINTKNHRESWVEIADKIKAEEIRDSLKLANIGTVVLSKRVDNQVPVIKCSNINSTALKNAILLIENHSTQSLTL